MLDPDVREALELAKAGNKFEARHLLNDILRDDPENADAWLILAQVAEDRGQAVRCLRQVLRLRPGDEKAQAALARLEHAEAKATSPQKVGRPAKAASGDGGSNLPIIVLGGIAALLVLVVLGGIAFTLLGGSRQGIAVPNAPGGSAPQIGPVVTVPLQTPRPRETETPIPFEMNPETMSMGQSLWSLPIQPHNQAEWMMRMGLLESIDPIAPKSYRVGQRQVFTVIVGGSLEEIPFVLEYQNSVVDMWVEEGYPADPADVRRAADTFATEIYPTVRDVFGEEWSPGIDGNPRLAIMNTFFLGANVGGYFSSSDEYPRQVYPFSNEQEAFYMSLLYGELGDEYYMSTLAHEFQHMVRYHQDANEQNWMDEGMAQLAERIAGYNTAFTHMNYLFDSQVSLNSWSINFRDSYSHYGAGYLYNQYLWERMGTDFIRVMAHDPEGGLKAVDNALVPYGRTADDLFADWIVANYVNNPSIEDGRYGYTNETLIPICPRQRLAEAQVQRPENTIPQYSPRYVELEGEGEFIINFKGDTDVPLIPSNPYSGRYIWWSNRENRSTMSLTRAFDLTGVNTATLQYWTWYEMPDRRDGGYVEISLDGGQTWQFLEGKDMRFDEDLFEYGLEYGHHYTDSSGGGTHGLWVNESIDLSLYTGNQVMIRFEYITDTYYEGAGWAIDNVRIPEINYLYDVEQGDDGWIAEGWVRTANRVPQEWTVSVVRYDGGVPTVERLQINPDGSASTTITLTPDTRRATVIIGAMAQTTNVDATYHLTIDGSGKMDSLRNPPGVLFQDNFENPCSTFYSFILPTYRQGYQNGKYEIGIDIEQAGLIAWAEQDLTNLILDVDTVQEKSQPDSITGVICRYQDDFNFYTFQLKGDGTFAIIRIDDGMPALLQDWTPSDAIRTGDGAANHLRVTCNGTTLALNINGTTVAQIEDEGIRRGDIAFYAATGDTKGILVSFDNLLVTQP